MIGEEGSFAGTEQPPVILRDKPAADRACSASTGSRQLGF
jgi:hypothetical protein